MQLTNYQFDPALAVEIGTKAAFAIGILVITWAVAKAAKWAFAKLVDRIGFLGRPTGSGESIGLSLGKIVSLLVWLFGLLAILDVLELGGVAGPITDLLGGLGIDGPITALGLLPDGTKASEVVARVAQIGIILFFAIAATRMLGFGELTKILDNVLGLGGNVLFGAVVIAVGFMIANLIAKFVGGASGGSSMAASVVRYAAILLFAFMGLQFMGVGEEIVQTAFSTLVIGLAVAGSLAFGLGGREWAAKKLEQLDKE